MLTIRMRILSSLLRSCRPSIGTPVAWCAGLMLIAASGIPAQAQTTAKMDLKNAYALAAENYAPQVQALLARMTLEEKVGQMTQLDIETVMNGFGDSAQIDPAKLDLVVRQHMVGSLFNAPGGRAVSGEQWRQIIHAIQAKAKETRLGIPVIYGVDSIHGPTYILGSTLFPQNIGMAATWNPSLVFREAEVTAAETRAVGIPWNFSPGLDAGRMPTWSRLYETYGEDPLLVATLGVNAIRGYQGDDLSRPDKVAACLKHYAGYGMSYNGKDRAPAWLPEIELRDYYLNGFAKGVDAGAASVMTNSAEVNGVPGVTNRRLLEDVLRKEMGFRGVVVSDYGDVRTLVNSFHTAADDSDAIRQAVLAGMDMSMVPKDFTFSDALPKLVTSGRVPVARIDEAVGRILTLKYALGLFEHPEAQADSRPALGKPESKQLSLEATRESITLLKNDGKVLPLKPGAQLLVTGPTANSLTALNGGWTYTWQGKDSKYFPEGSQTIVSALQQRAKVTYVSGTDPANETELSAVVDAAKKADAVVICIGEEAYAEIPGTIADLTLPRPQLQLVQELEKTKKPIILVLVEGRPRLISDVADDAQAIVMTYLPGPFGPQALSEVLFGDVNPSGRLPFTYPRFPNLLMPYDHHFWEGQGTAPGQGGFRPQFEFGAGLSYTSFAYSKLKVTPEEISSDGTVEISVNVQNTGERSGKEVVELYASQAVGSVVPAVKRLKGFQKIELKAGESRTVTFALKAGDFKVVNSEGRNMYEPGVFKLAVGSERAQVTLQ